MTHATELELSMLADEALPAASAERVTAHLGACETCQARLTALQAESRYLAAAMRVETLEPERAIPKFTRPASLRGFALANVATALVIWLMQFLWKTLFGELVVNAASWATSLYLPDIYGMASSIVLQLLEEGTAMLDSYLGFVVIVLVAVTALGLVFMRQRVHGDALGLCLLLTVAGVMAAPTPAAALEVRRSDDLVTVAETETVDDTLLIASETVRIEGIVSGDLVALGEEVEISGTVRGNVVAFAETVTITGEVGGFVLGGASVHTLSKSSVGGDLWLAGDRIDVLDDVRIDGNAAFAGESASVGAAIGRDLLAVGETIEVSGEVGGDIEAAGDRLRLLGGARIGGDVRFRGDPDRLYRADGVVVAGEIEFPDPPKALEKENRYLTAAFYVWQIGELIAAFLFGLALLWFVPGLRRQTIGAGAEGLKSAGIGFVALVTLPIAAVVAAVTLIGLPFAAFVFVAWLLGLYLALIVVGSAIGQMVLGGDESLPLTLFVGLAVVAVLVNLPFFGGILGFLLMILGLGLLVQYLYGVLSDREPGGMEGAG